METFCLWHILYCVLRLIVNAWDESLLSQSLLSIGNEPLSGLGVVVGVALVLEPFDILMH